MENFVLPCMPVCGMYICVCCMFITWRVHGRFYGLDLRKEWSSWETRHRYARFVNDEENGCRFEGQWKETWIYTRPAWLIPVREIIHEHTGIGCDTSS